MTPIQRTILAYMARHRGRSVLVSGCRDTRMSTGQFTGEDIGHAIVRTNAMTISSLRTGGWVKKTTERMTSDWLDHEYQLTEKGFRATARMRRRTMTAAQDPKTPESGIRT